jgi:hypothetical protein
LAKRLQIGHQGADPLEPRRHRPSIDRIRAIMHHFRDEPGCRKSTAPSRKLWTALYTLDGYLTSQSA